MFLTVSVLLVGMYSPVFWSRLNSITARGNFVDIHSLDLLSIKMLFACKVVLYTRSYVCGEERKSQVVEWGQDFNTMCTVHSYYNPQGVKSTDFNSPLTVID